MNSDSGRISTLKIAATYIGTIIGAGFASGQEILQFFAVYGSMGFLGVLVVTVLFAVFGFIIINMGFRLHSHSYLEIITLAGAGALFKDQLGIPNMWGNLLVTVFTLVTVFLGINGVINSLSIIVPFLPYRYCCIRYNHLFPPCRFP